MLLKGKNRWANAVNWIGRTVLAAAAILFLYQCHLLWHLKIDDAYITYRYGARLAHFGNMKWNLTEPPVEGFTSILSNFISAGFEVLRLDPLYCWKIMSIVLALGAAFCIVQAGRIFCSHWMPRANDWGLPYFVAAPYLAIPLIAIHAMSGMETALYSFLLIFLTMVAFAIVMAPEGRIAKYWLLFVGFFLLGLTRPEGVLWGAIVTVGVGLGLPRDRWGKYVRAFFLFFFLPGLLYFVARWIYFGDFLSPTFFAKSGNSMKPGQGRLMTYLPSRHEVYAYLRDYWALYMLLASAAGACVCACVGRKVFWENKAKIAALSLLFLASLACIEFFSAMHMLMGYAYRFLFPYGQTFLLTLLLPMIVLCVKALGPITSKQRNDIAAIANSIAVITILLFLAPVITDRTQFAWRDSKRFYSLLATNNVKDDGYTRVGKALDAVALRLGRQLTLFHHNMGELMYFSPHWDTIEALGLIDRHTAHHGFHPDYVFDMRNPELLLLPSMKSDAITPYPAEFLPDISYLLYKDPRFARYDYIGYFPGLTFGTEGKMHFFFRKDLLEQNPWVRPFLVTKLGLRADADLGRSK